MNRVTISKQVVKSMVLMLVLFGVAVGSVAAVRASETIDAGVLRGKGDVEISADCDWYAAPDENEQPFEAHPTTFSRRGGYRVFVSFYTSPLLCGNNDYDAELYLVNVDTGERTLVWDGDHIYLGNDEYEPLDEPGEGTFEFRHQGIGTYRVEWENNDPAEPIYQTNSFYLPCEAVPVTNGNVTSVEVVCTD